MYQIAVKAEETLSPNFIIQIRLQTKSTVITLITFPLEKKIRQLGEKKKRCLYYAFILALIF